MRLIHHNTSGKLPTSTYKFIVNDQPVGFTQIRHRASAGQDVPENFANHIYYEIYPPFREMGYGKKILEFALKKAREKDIEEIIVCCNEANTASHKIIRHNGGEYRGKCNLTTDDILLKYVFK